MGLYDLKIAKLNAAVQLVSAWLARAGDLEVIEDCDAGKAISGAWKLLAEAFQPPPQEPLVPQFSTQQGPLL